MVAKAIIALRNEGLNVGSIVGDNHPVQVAALDHWNPRSLPQNQGPDFRGVRFQAPLPCALFGYGGGFRPVRVPAGFE
jgi:hypothetical protein